ncbi:ABC transporter substrate-binding protein [Streptomyces rubellomurinus]|uniref:ABC transporter substrate-binding protein n=1 Tax=Streptomyces sp. Y1 TaxID=3238634 RepID=A0AB39TKJ2_9ACTN|nr:ABC transporter substrate-binding protein [Streptomyces rubellomurinus]
MDASSAAPERSDRSAPAPGAPGYPADLVDLADPAGADGEPELERLGLDQLRILRRETLEQEADLSYLRRLLHGRMDILRAELDRRPGGGPARAAAAVGEQPPGDLLGRLAAILTDAPSTVRRSARHVTLGPPRTRESRLEADELMGDVQLADLAAHPAEELLAALERLRAHEREVSGRRQRLLRTADGCNAEITRRYRDGEARVDDLLAGGPL